MRPTLIILCIISLISFDSVCQDGEQPYKWTYICQISPVDSLDSPDTIQYRVSASTITKSHSIEQSRIINQLQIREKDKEFLLDILLKGNAISQHEQGGLNCYTPSNGVLFYDKHDGLVGFIELSVECMEFRAIGICADWNMKIDSTDYEFLGKWFDENFK